MFLSGGTGYLGRPLAAALLANGDEVRVLCRKNSLQKCPSGVIPILGNALDANSFAESVRGCSTFIHLTGISHPAPWKEQQFRDVDLTSLRASAASAVQAGVAHFVYVSVAGPAPVMRSYIRIRRECEAILAATGIPGTILRPWYVLGPGHWWPWILKPFYAAAEHVPAWRDGALRLSLVTQREMVTTLAWTVGNPATGRRVIEVPEIRRIGRNER